MKKLFIVLLSLAILGLIIIKFIDINTLPLRSYKLSKLPFILTISSLLSILSLLSFEKKIVFLSIFSFAGIFIVSSVALSFLFKTEDFEKIDYCFSQKVENYEYKKYVDEFNWTNERFIHQNDTIYFAYPSKQDNHKEKKYSLRKSLFQQFYYLKN